ncbi:immunoglobulin superfamily, member 1 [Chelydra serpentina]|nr:immunoglobulin superfamily, member 1 [Chelydra serpentina]
MAEFRIPSVGREAGGSYTCDYHSITEQNRWSHPSDPVEIIVAELPAPGPSISVSPSGVIAPGGAVTSAVSLGAGPGGYFAIKMELKSRRLMLMEMGVTSAETMRAGETQGATVADIAPNWTCPSCQSPGNPCVSF